MHVEKESRALEKIGRMEEKKNELLEVKQMEFEEKKQRMNRLYTKNRKNRELIDKLIYEERNGVLMRQYNFNHPRATSEKPRDINDIRAEMAENYFVNQVELSKKYKDYIYMMNRMKDQAVSRMSYSAKRRAYLKLKKEEEARLKKLQEEKLLGKNKTSD